MASIPSVPSISTLVWLASFGLFQAAWFATALLAGHARPLLATLPMLGFALIHLVLWSRARMATLVLLACAAGCGLVVDGALILLGATTFAIAPWFMVALWIGFACTLETSLAKVARRPLAGAALGLIGGPLAYRGGAALGALTVTDGAAALAQIGVLWMAALPALGVIATQLAIEKYARRARTLPRLALFFAVLVVGAPGWLLLAWTVDVARGNKPRASVRVVAFGVVFVVVEVYVLALTLVDTLRLRGPALLQATLGRQQQFTRGLLTGVERVFRIRVVVEGDACAAPGPVIVLARHASIVDTLLPSVVVTQGHGVALRFVLKRELLEDPCLDIAGTRLPNHFVSRSAETTREDLDAITELARGLSATDGVLIYPEGTRFTEPKRARAVAAMTDAPLRDIAATLRHTLPPKAGGTLAALSGAPDADVVFLAHRGLDGFALVKDIWSGAMLDRTVRVKLWRITRAAVPPDDDGRKRWLFEQWAQLDRVVDAMEATL